MIVLSANNFNNTPEMWSWTLQSKIDNEQETGWTFFRVKLVMGCDFEISWTLGPWEPGTLESRDFGTLEP